MDIGGSLGHDLRSFKVRHPSKSGRLILQDLPHVIENAKQNPDLYPAIEKMPYDLFTPQPIKGARIYLLRAILHDWPDADAIRILETLRPAVRKGYSKLLIQEIVIPETRPNVRETTRDWTMLSFVSGCERTEQHWQELISSAGLRIIRYGVAQYTPNL